MRVMTSKSKNSESLYIIKCIQKNGVRTTKIVESLGTVEELSKKLSGKSPHEWAKERAAELTMQEKEQNRKVTIELSPSDRIDKNEIRTFNGGYLFLQKLYHDLGLHKICKGISKQYKFDYDLNSILSRLLYSRIIFPASKRATMELSNKFIEPPNFDIHHIYRGLEVIAKETDYIQSELYKNSKLLSKRKTGILYYDCTNFFFEIEQEEGIKQYGLSKENRPNPLVQMGLFMDGDGIPLAFTITSGNTNEQTTLQPLEEKILTDFDLSKFVVCTDAGLSSTANRKFNDKGGRAFVTTQSIRKLKKHLKEWSIDPTGWRLPESDAHFNKSKPFEEYDISVLDDEKYKGSTFYKERWINEDGLEQKLIITYSIKYRDYQRVIRGRQIERAEKLIKTNPTKLKKVNGNDYKRFIQKRNVTLDGEIAERELYNINTETIAAEEIFDGFYGVCTNLDDEPAAIIKINHRRWEIEECFRIMKSEFEARPVYLQRDDRIKAHFTTCFISLMLFRFLEKRLEEKFTCCQIIEGLREMNFLKIHGEGYIPTYTRSDFSDALHDAFAFHTDSQIIPLMSMKNFLQKSKT